MSDINYNSTNKKAVAENTVAPLNAVQLSSQSNPITGVNSGLWRDSSGNLFFRDTALNIQITADGGLNFANPNDISLQQANDTDTAITTTIFPGGFVDTYASVTFNTTKANEWVLVGFHARIKHPPGAGEGLLVAYQLDGGSDTTVTSSYFAQGISQTAPNCHFNFPLQVASAGSHTIKIRSRTFSGGGNGEVNSQDSLVAVSKRSQLYVLNIDESSEIHDFEVNTDTDSSNILINSATYADTGLQATITTTSADEVVLLGYAGAAQPNANGLCTLDLAYQVDGGSDVEVYRTSETAEAQRDISFMLPITIATPGSHTIKLRARNATNTWDLIGTAATYGSLNLFWAVKLVTNGSKRFAVASDVETANQTVSTADPSWQTLSNSVSITTTKTDEVVLLGYVGIVNCPTATFPSALAELHTAYRVDGGAENEFFISTYVRADRRPVYFTNVIELATPGSHTFDLRAKKINSGATTENLVLYGSSGSIPNASTLFALRFAGSVITLGDNLGNHTATQNVDMGGFNITNLDTIDSPINYKRTPTAVSYQTSNDYIVEVTDTTAPRTITLATADVAEGRWIVVKDGDGTAGTNNITIATQGSELIDGAASVLIDSNYGAKLIYSDGVNWFTIPTGSGGGASAFTDLTDVPSSYSGEALKIVRVNAGETGLEFVAGGGGVTDFTDLGDVPSSYTGDALKLVRVNAGETGLEFVDSSVVPASETITEDTNASNFTITGTSYTDTGLEVSITTVEGERPELKFIGVMNAVAASQAYCIFGYQIDAGATVDGIAANTGPTGDGVNVSFSRKLPAMTAGVHTVKIRAKEVSAGATDGQLLGTSGGIDCRLQIIQGAPTQDGVIATQDTLGANFTTNSGTYVDTGLEVTINTIEANEIVMVGFTGVVYNNTNTASGIALGVRVDAGTEEEIGNHDNQNLATFGQTLSGQIPVTIVTPGSHTIKLRMKTTAGITWGIVAPSAVAPNVFYTLQYRGGSGSGGGNLTTYTTAVSYSTAGEDMIFVDDVTASRTITLSTADVVDGKVIGIKDISGGDISANTTVITIATQGSELIDGAASIDITADYGYLEVVSNGTDWFIR